MHVSRKLCRQGMPGALCLFSLWATPLPALAESTLPQVTVSGGAVSDLEERRAAVTQKVIIDRAGIAATGGLTVGEVLGKLPGVDAGTPGSDGSMNLKARGMSRDSVQVLVDGERPAAGSRHGMLIISRMPAGELERVEIIKGASAEFGNTAPVTINLVTQRGKKKSGVNVRASLGARGKEPTASLSITPEGGSGPWSWSLPISLNEFRTPIERETERRHWAGGAASLWQNEAETGRNRYGERYFAPKLNWKQDQSSFSLWPMIFRATGNRKTTLEREQYADPVNGAGPALTLARDDREHSKNAIDRLRAEGETLLGGNKLSARLSLSQSRRDTDIARLPRLGGAASSEFYRRDGREINAGLRADRAWGEHFASLGVEFIRLDRKESQAFSGLAIGNDTYRSSETQQVLWVQDEFTVTPAVSLTAGLRGERLALATDALSNSTHSLSPSLAARWDFSGGKAAGGWVLRASAGSGLKAPKLDEISDAPVPSVGANSPLEPDRRGNPALRPEKSWNLELGAEHYWPNETAVVGMNFYARDTQDFIERRVMSEGARWVERPYNEGRARHWGIEFDFKLKTDDWGLKGGALRSHLTLPRATVNDERLGRRRPARETPRYLLTLGYDQALPALSSSAGFLLQQNGATRTDIPDEQWADTRPRAVLDAYWVRKLGPATNLRLTLQNILGADTRRLSRFTADGQEWRLGNEDRQARAVVLMLEGKW